MTETRTDRTITANIGGRSPIKYHGVLGDKGETGVLYASMPMALARDNLKPATHSVANLLWSHTEGWEVSVAAIAEARSMSRPTASKAVGELEAKRWLVRQPYGQPGKKPAGEVWHLQRTNVPFTEDEVKELSALVVIGGGGGKNLPTPGAKKVSTGGGNNLSTKVVHPKVVQVKDRDSVTESGGPTTIPDDWHVNGIHVNAGKAIHLNTAAVGDVFKRWAQGENIRRTDFDKTFGALLQLIEHNLCPDDLGFVGMSEYANGDDLWWEQFVDSPRQVIHQCD